MKKTAIILGILALGVSVAIAYGPGMGRGYQQGGMHGYGHPGGMMGGYYGQSQGAPGYGRGMMPGYNCQGPYSYGNQQSGQIGKDEAKGKVTSFMKNNLKGFKIVDQEQISVSRGSIHQFTVEDDNGNRFLLRVNPFGYVVGPFPAGNVSQQ